MGFEDRDYSQEETWRGNPDTSGTFVTKWFVIIAVTVFVLQALTITPASPFSFIYEWLSLYANDVLHGQVWRLFTFVICNDPIFIITFIFTMLIIWNFGNELERMYGSRELLLYYLCTTVFVGLGFILWGLVVPLRRPLDSSAAIALGALSLYATHFPRTEIHVFLLIAIQLRFVVALYALWLGYPALIALQQGNGVASLAYASSLLSIVFALAYRRYNWHLAAATTSINFGAWRRAWRSRMSRKKLRVYNPVGEVVDLDSKVDALLAKIHEHGSESLTEDERAILVRASERMKNRSP